MASRNSLRNEVRFIFLAISIGGLIVGCYWWWNGQFEYLVLSIASMFIFAALSLICLNNNWADKLVGFVYGYTSIAMSPVDAFNEHWLEIKEQLASHGLEPDGRDRKIFTAQNGRILVLLSVSHRVWGQGAVAIVVSSNVMLWGNNRKSNNKLPYTIINLFFYPDAPALDLQMDELFDLLTSPGREWPNHLLQNIIPFGNSAEEIGASTNPGSGEAAHQSTKRKRVWPARGV